MKLRNLLLASLAVCTFASCSKDDDGPAVPQEMDAYISVAAIAGDSNTKASTDGGSENGLVKEQVVKSLTAFVFKGEGEPDAGTFVISKKVQLAENGTATDAEVGTVGEGENQMKTITAIKDIHVKVAALSGATTSQTKFKVVLLANMDLTAPKSLDEFKKMSTPDISTFTTIGGHFLPMSSNELPVENLKPYETGATEHEANWFGQGNPIKLTRAISRVQIDEIKTDFQGQYKNAEFTVDSIYLANVRANETVMGGLNEEAPYYRGGPVEYSVLDELIAKGSLYKDISSLLKKYTSNNVLGNGKSTDFTNFQAYINVNSPKSVDGTKDNPQTRLIISGNLKLDGRELGRKYFHIPLKNITSEGGNVVNNKIYKVTATITGEGNPEPDRILDNACINFKITVEQWKVVNQKEEDIN